MPYMYSAAFHCDKCGAAICAQLDAAGKRPTYPEPWDTDDYPAHYPDAGEADCPQSCDSCHEPLDYSLTSDGVEYVLNAITESLEEAIAKGRAETWDKIHPCYAGTYWEGSRHVEIVRSWAEHISAYNLDNADAALVSLFLDLSKPVNP